MFVVCWKLQRGSVFMGVNVWVSIEECVLFNPLQYLGGRVGIK